MDIQFCNNCENMTILCIEDETNELVSKCKCCGNVSPIKQTSKSVYNMSNSKIDKLDIIKSNQYIIMILRYLLSKIVYYNVIKKVVEVMKSPILNMMIKI